MKSAFTGQTVADLMTGNPVTVHPETSLLDLVNQTLFRHRISFVPVVEEGVLLGYVDTDIVGRVDPAVWPETRVADVFITASERSIVEPDLAIEALMPLMTRLERRKFLVADGQRLLGVISLSDLMAYLALRQAVPLPDPVSAPGNLHGPAS